MADAAFPATARSVANKMEAKLLIDLRLAERSKRRGSVLNGDRVQMLNCGGVLRPLGGADVDEGD